MARGHRDTEQRYEPVLMERPATGQRASSSAPASIDTSASGTVTDPTAYRAIVRNLRFLLASEFAAELDNTAAEDPTLGYRIERRVLETLGDAEATPMSSQDRQAAVDDVTNELLGTGPLQPLLDDPTVTEIMVNGPAQVFVERSGVYEAADRCFDDAEHLTDVVGRMLAAVGRRLDADSPVIEVRMPDGSRVSAVLPPLAIDGPVLAIRKFAHDSFTAEDLISFGTLDERLAEFLSGCVRGRLNVLISGASGTGRTTLLNVLGAWIGDDERIVTVEDAAELHLPQPQVVRLETRAPDVDGNGGVGLRELVRIALRLHADRVALSEVCGDEAFEMLMAMGAGHDGWMSTIYGCSPADALARFETLALLAAGSNAPVHAVRAQVSAAFDVVIHLVRLRDGTRRVMQIAEVGDPTDEGIELRTLFEFDASHGLDSTGRLRGRVVSTGLMPVFSHRLVEAGVATEQLGLGLE